MCLNLFLLFAKTHHTPHYILKTKTLIVDVQKNKTAAEKNEYSSLSKWKRYKKCFIL